MEEGSVHARRLLAQEPVHGPPDDGGDPAQILDLDATTGDEPLIDSGLRHVQTLGQLVPADAGFCQRISQARGDFEVDPFHG